MACVVCTFHKPLKCGGVPDIGVITRLAGRFYHIDHEIAFDGLCHGRDMLQTTSKALVLPVSAVI
jgi:hypothetical protein